MYYHVLFRVFIIYFIAFVGNSLLYYHWLLADIHILKTVQSMAWTLSKTNISFVTLVSMTIHWNIKDKLNVFYQLSSLTTCNNGLSRKNCTFNERFVEFYYNTCYTSIKQTCPQENQQ